MRCFYCENLREGELSPSDFSKNESTHLFKVLRGKTGDRILLINGTGTIAEAEIIGKDSIIVDVIKQLPAPNIKLNLFVAPPRKQKIDSLLKQSAEIGVWSINLIETERGISQPEKGSAFMRMRQHIQEGCKQAHNPFLPKLNPPIALKNAIIAISDMDAAYFGSTSGNTSKIEHNKNKTINIAWLVGPEGGFTDDEEQLMLGAGIKPLSLGQWIMRIETAAITGSHLLAYSYSSSSSTLGIPA